MNKDKKSRSYNAPSWGVGVLLEALERIQTASDFCRVTGDYPKHPNGPDQEQSFDDWAADVAEAALDAWDGRTLCQD